MASTWPAKNNYATGDVLTAANMNGIGDDLNDLYAQTVSGGSAYAAGKNKIINGDFSIWQRGTSFTTAGAFTADRWQMTIGLSGSVTVSQQAFTAGAAPVAGYESQYFLRYASTNAVDARIFQAIEDVRTFANQTVTVSFWAKSATSDALANVSFRQNFGSGGSANVDTTSSSFTLTSSWARYSATLSIPSVSGKTIGANSYLRLTFDLKDSATYDFDFWGVQVEAGSTATPFQTATGTIQGELAACQRYYYRQTADSAYSLFASGIGYSGTTIYGNMLPPVTMRVEPTGLEFANIAVWDGTTVTATSNPFLAIDSAFSSKNQVFLTATIASGGVQYRPYWIIANNSTSAYVGFSAEL